MAQPLNFTKSSIEALPYSQRNFVEYRDSGGKSSRNDLYLRVGKRTKTYYCFKYNKTKSVRVKIGLFDNLSVEQARKRCKTISDDIEQGIDPNAARKLSRNKAPTLQDIVMDYIEHAAKRAVRPIKSSTAENYERIIQTHFSKSEPIKVAGRPYNNKLGRGYAVKPASELSTEQVSDWYRQAIGFSVSSANSAMRVCKAAYNLHLKNSLSIKNHNSIKTNPFAGISLVPEPARCDYIEPTQLPDWFKAVQGLDNEVMRDYLVFVLFTGLRRREAASLRWEQVDLKKRVVEITNTKNSQPLIVPLSDFLVKLLISRSSSGDGDFVFPSSGKTGYISEPKKSLKSVNEAASTVTTVHGLRRTYSSIAIFHAGIPDAARKMLLNHAPSKNDITERHYTFLPIDELRKYQQIITETIIEIGNLQFDFYDFK